MSEEDSEEHFNYGQFFEEARKFYDPDTKGWGPLVCEGEEFCQARRLGPREPSSVSQGLSLGKE